MVCEYPEERFVARLRGGGGNRLCAGECRELSQGRAILGMVFPPCPAPSMHAMSAWASIKCCMGCVLAFHAPEDCGARVVAWQCHACVWGIRPSVEKWGALRARSP